MSILAIKGDEKRGNEVIALLEMLGGHNGSNLLGNKSDYVYFITDSSDIGCRDTNHILTDYFTLDKFYEKYPYKVGDKVTLDHKLCTVIWMCWECNNIYYTVQNQEAYCMYLYAQKVTADELKPYKEQDNMETTVESNKRDRDDVLFDSIIWHLRNSVNNGKQHLSGGDCEAYFRELVKKVKMYKPIYPKTYVECCDILNVCQNIPTVPGWKGSKIAKLQQLVICRDAYWKIAGEEMGLDGSWEPSLVASNGDKWVLYNCGGTIINDIGSVANNILTFPTSEMRDAFYENFKDLVEKCKELL